MRKVGAKAAAAPAGPEIELALLRQRVEQLESALGVSRSEAAISRATLERQVARAEGMLEQMNSELNRMRGGAHAGIAPREEAEAPEDEETQAVAQRWDERFGSGLDVEEMIRRKAARRSEHAD